MAKKEEKTLEQLKAEAELAQAAYELAKKEAEQKEFEEAQRKKAKLEAEKEKRRQEIEEAEKHYQDLVKKYVEDYGQYEVNHSYKNGDDFISLLFGSNPLKLFL